MSNTNYIVVQEDSESLHIQDVGPWTKYKTVSNAAEEVVEELIGRLHGRRLFYYDSAGDFNELCIRNGKFFGFAPAVGK